MAELNKFKSGNENGVGRDFTDRYSQAFESVIKDKFPDYIEPGTLTINFNDPKSIENFNKMVEMKEKILNLVEEKLNGDRKEKETLEKSSPNDKHEPKNTFSKEDQENYERLENEISMLEQEIRDLEIKKQSLEQPMSEQVDDLLETKEAPELTPETPKPIEIVSENMSIEDYKKSIDKIVRDNLGATLEDNGLDYEDTVVTHTENSVHTEIKFNNKKIVLSFDLVSEEGRAVLKNDDWTQTGWNKFITFNKLNKKTAEGLTEKILNKFINNNSKDKDFHKVDIQNGALILEHKV